MSPGRMRVNPDDLRRAAELLDSASTKTEQAGRQAESAIATTNPFGISAAADQLRTRWNAATRARFVEEIALARAINELAEDLRAAADSYDGTDSGNADTVENSAKSDFTSAGN